MRVLPMLGVVAAANVFFFAAPATAAPIAVVGPGTGYVTTGGLDDLTACSFAAVGYDAAGRLVGLTAGHCVLAPGLPVTLIGNPQVGPVGTTASGHWGPDFGVIVLDAAKVVPVSSAGGVTVTDIGRATPGQRVCKGGAASGITCGTVLEVRAGGDITTDTPTVWADSGGALVSGTTLVGIASHADSVPVLGPTVYASAAASLDLLDAAGGPGSGFRPI
ncbi:S1 family peptidase [Rhodococcus sp. AW25M09]|uniref:S1 family peptidase n=1 Tax=Rhodococcus sp. AW25M09 TaxID=1268303 RepID=UPI001E4F58D8|nr:S1 family peptidase [Rhodococcus sp. AW25M09]